MPLSKSWKYLITKSTRINVRWQRNLKLLLLDDYLLPNEFDDFENLMTRFVFYKQNKSIRTLRMVIYLWPFRFGGIALR